MSQPPTPPPSAGPELNALKLLLDLHFDEIPEKSINLLSLNQPLFQLSTPFLQKFLTPPLSVNFGKFKPHLGRGDLSYEVSTAYRVRRSVKLILENYTAISKQFKNSG